MTKNSKIIVKYLEDKKIPMSATDIFEGLKGLGYNIHLSTIYRNINSMVESKVIYEAIEGTLGEKLYGIEREHKHYITCVNCKKIKEIKGCLINKLESEISKDVDDFEIISHKLMFEGICRNCKNIKIKKVEDK